MDNEMVVHLLEEEGISHDLIEKLLHEQLIDFDNLEEMSTWAPKDISSTLGVPIGMVMPNKFGKRIQKIVEKLKNQSGETQEDNEHVDPAALVPPPLPPPAIAVTSTIVTTSSSPAAVSSVAMDSSLNLKSSDKTNSLDYWLVNTCAFSPLRAKFIMEQLTGKQILTIDDLTAALKEHSHLFLKEGLIQSNEELSLRNNLLLTSSSTTTTPPIISEDPTLPKIRQLHRHLSKLSEGSSENNNNSNTFDFPNMSYCNSCVVLQLHSFSPSLMIELIVLKELWLQHFEAAEELSIRRFQRFLYKQLMELQPHLTKSEAKISVEGLISQCHKVDIMKNNLVNILSLRALTRVISPLDCSFQDICSFYSDPKSLHPFDEDITAKRSLMPPLPVAYVAIDKPDIDSKIHQALQTCGWNLITGAKEVGKSIRILSICHRSFFSHAEVVYVDLSGEVSSESLMISCLASQLCLGGMGAINSSASVLISFRKLLNSLDPKSILILDNINTESCATSCANLFKVCAEFQSKLSICVICRTAEWVQSLPFFSSAAAKDQKEVILIPALTPQESKEFAAHFNDDDAAVIAGYAATMTPAGGGGFLPGDCLPNCILSLSSIHPSVLHEIMNSTKSNKRTSGGGGSSSSLSEVIYKVMSEKERILASCLAPLIGITDRCPLECLWSLCQAHFPNRIIWENTLQKLKKLRFLKESLSSSDVILLVDKLPMESTITLSHQFSLYYTYWAQQLSDIFAAYHHGKYMSSLYYFDSYRIHFTHLFTSWHSSNPPATRDLSYQLACEIAGKVGLFCEMRMSPSYCTKACRGIHRIFEEYEGQGATVTTSAATSSPGDGLMTKTGMKSIKYWNSAIDLSRCLYSNNQFLEAMEHVQDCVSDVKRNSTIESSDSTRYYVLGNACSLLGKISESLGQHDNCLSYFNESIDYFGQESRYGLDSRDVAEVYHKLGNILRNSGDYTQAEVVYQKSIEGYKAVYSADHSDIASVLTDLGSLFNSQGDLENAKKYYLEALEMRKVTLGSEHYETAHSYNNLAVLFHSDGNYSEALVYYQEALPIYLSCFSEYHPDVAASYNNIGALYDDMENFIQARNYYEKALSIRRAVLDPESIDLAASINNLAALLDDQGMPSEAKELYYESLELYRKVLGNCHPDVASCIINLAALIDDEGDYETAQRLYQEALEIFIEIYGGECCHADVGSTLICLANLEKQQNHLKLSQEYFERAIVVYKAISHGSDHLTVAQATYSLASLLKSDGKYEEAKPLYLEALRIRKNLLGPYHPEVAQTLRCLGILFKATRYVDAAIETYKELLDVVRHIYGTNDVEIVTVMIQLATLLKNRSYLSEACELLKEAVDMNRHLHGTRSLVVAETLSLLGMVLKSKSQYLDAIESYEECRAIRREHLGIEHQLVAKTTHDIGLVYWSKGDRNMAKSFLEDALRMRQRILPDHHPDIIQSLTSLSSLLGEDERYYLEAKKLFEESLQMRKNLLGAEHAEIATSLLNFATLGFALGKYADVKPYLDQALRIRKKQFGDHHEKVAECWIQLGKLCVNQRHYREAETYFEDALMIFQNNFGKESQQAALALIELGTMYKIQCKFEEATHDLVEAKNILTHHFPHSPSDSNHSPQGSFAPSARGFPVTTAPVATSNDSTGLPPTGGDGDDVNADTTQSLPVADILKKLASINVSMKNSDLALKQYEEAIEIMQLNLGPDHLDIAEVLLDIGDLLRNDQFYDEAIDSYCEALQIQRQSLGSESIEVAQTLHTLGDIYKRTAQFVDAKKRYEECLNIRRLVLGDYHVDVALGYHNLAALLDRMGDLEGAEKNFKIALELRREVLGPTHPDVAQTLNNLAAILDDLNRPNDAEPLYREALTIYKDIFGDDHPDVALSLNNLGALLDDKGEYSKALPLYEEALSITRNIYGEESLEVASALVCLANALQHLKRYDEAEKLFERILAMKVKHFGEKSLEVAMIKYLYAELFLLQGEVSDAKELLEEVVAIRSSLLGVNHSSVSAILDKISEIDYQSQSAAQSQCQQQNPIQLAADLEIKQAQVGKDHISVAGDLIVLGSSLFDDQEYEKALERYQEGLVIYRREYGDVNVITVETIDMIIGCLQKLDRYEEAEKLCLESIETKKTLFDPEAYQVGDAIHTLASLYDKQRMDTQAIEKYKECLKIQRKTYGKYDPLIAQTLNNLAAILDDLGQPEEAEPYYKEALEIYRHAYGSHHPDVALSLNNLAALLDDRGCYEEAKDLYQEALGITRVVFGDSSPEVASAVICLASVLKRLKLYSEAERYYDEALKLKIALTGLDTTLECASLHDQIGAMCQLQKKFKEAKLSFEKGLEIRVFQHGNDHLDIAQSLEKLASLSEESGNYNDALNYLQRALNLRVKHYGHRTSPDVANVLVMLANINKKVRKFNESMQHYTEALGIYKGCNGSVHETVAETLCSMASLKRSTHHYEEAISLYDKAIAIYKSLQTHPSKVAQILGSIGAVYEKRKMLDEALIRYEAALSLQKEIYGGEIHSEVANSMTNMAVILKNQKNYSLSHLYYQKSLEIRKALYGPNHPDVAQSMNNLAALLYIEKKYDMARKLYEDSLAILTELYGHDNLDVAQALNNLAALLFAEKRFHESNKLYEESLNIRMKHLGRNHLDVASSLCNLGILKRSTHEYQEATRYFRDSLDIRLHLLRDESHNDVQVCRKHLAYVEQMSCPITVGMVVTYTDKATGKKYKAVVTKKHSNGTYDVKYSPTNQRGSDENDVSAMTATETYVGRHRLAVSPSSDASSTTSLSGASDNASVERKTKEKHRQGHVQQFPPQPPPPPPHRDAFADPTKSTVPPPPPPPPREKRQSFLPTSPSKRNDNSSEFSDDMSAGDTAAVLTTSPTKAPVSSEEESTHVHSAIGISLEKEKHKPTLHSKSSRNLLLPPPNEVGTLKIPMKSLSRGMSRAQQLNQYSRQQSSAVAAAEAEASQYKSNVGSAGFRMSNKSFRLKKLASGLGSSEESDEDDSDFFSPTKQKQFDHSETTSVVSGFADYHHHERPDSRPERPGRGERLSDAVGSPFKKGGGVVVPTNRGSEFAASSGGGVDGPPSSRRR